MVVTLIVEFLTFQKKLELGNKRFRHQPCAWKLPSSNDFHFTRNSQRLTNDRLDDRYVQITTIPSHFVSANAKRLLQRPCHSYDR
jgi:hypothetical protein